MKAAQQALDKILKQEQSLATAKLKAVAALEQVKEDEANREILAAQAEVDAAQATPVFEEGASDLRPTEAAARATYVLLGRLILFLQVLLVRFVVAANSRGERAKSTFEREY